MSLYMGVLAPLPREVDNLVSSILENLMGRVENLEVYCSGVEHPICSRDVSKLVDVVVSLLNSRDVKVLRRVVNLRGEKYFITVALLEAPVKTAIVAVYKHGVGKERKLVFIASGFKT